MFRRFVLAIENILCGLSIRPGWFWALRLQMWLHRRGFRPACRNRCPGLYSVCGVCGEFLVDCRC